ncbi:MSS116 [[Candida] subhashii]|uniref:RNA helicase n=1 Tax=[Candida] subhashii TaxID=561895 RepID=A0A8J5UQC6_9ASCO|nr:MSS116 [[Candida] subhashii]KAG7664067.1 MSS116 [[Candida] subhashii]
MIALRKIVLKASTRYSITTATTASASITPAIMRNSGMMMTPTRGFQSTFSNKNKSFEDIMSHMKQAHENTIAKAAENAKFVQQAAHEASAEDSSPRFERHSKNRFADRYDRRDRDNDYGSDRRGGYGGRGGYGSRGGRGGYGGRERGDRVGNYVREQLPEAPEPTKIIDESFVPISPGDFKGTGLIRHELLEALEVNEYKEFTPIQKEAIIPALKTEKGLVCRAKTGTGKTLTFIIPTVEYVLNNHKPGIKALIVAPTRDLADQIVAEYNKVINGLDRKVRPKTLLICGGKPNRIDPRSPPDIVVATPGRLEADLKNPEISSLFDQLAYRVYDEADRLLDIGFEPSLDAIDRQIHRVRDQTVAPLKSLLFSATIDETIAKFARKHIHPNYDYINTVSENDADVHENIHQVLVKCNDQVDKFQTVFSYIVEELKVEGFKGMLFLPTKTAVDWFHKSLLEVLHSDVTKVHGEERSRYNVYTIHGGKSVGQRNHALASFKTHKQSLLITTDVAARGIDVKNVSHVIQMSPSSETADYVHKVGRTGRAGAKGTAITFICAQEVGYIKRLQQDFQIDFHEVTKSEDMPQFQCLENLVPDEFGLNDFMGSYMGYAASLIRTYRMDPTDVVREIGDFQRFVLQDPSAKLRLPRQVEGQFAKISPDVRQEYVSGGSKGFGFRTGGHRGEKRGGFDRGSSYDDGFRAKRYNNYERGYSQRDSYQSRGGRDGYRSYGGSNRDRYGGGNRNNEDF